MRSRIASVLMGFGLLLPAVALAAPPSNDAGAKITVTSTPPVVSPFKPASTPNPTPTPTPDAEKQPDYNAVVLQALNKVTGHTSKLDGPLGTVMRFGTLEIIARRCWVAPPEDRPENAALLEIRELKPGEGPQQIFLGWMFSSSPGLSGLEHAVYDINVLSCEARPDPEKKESPAADATPAKKPAKK